MASENQFSTPRSFSPQSESEKQTAPRFAVCETLAVIESGETDEWDDTSWRDYVSQFADTGVRP